MLNSVKGLALTFMSTLRGLRKPVTHQYPNSRTFAGKRAVPTPVQDRFMGFPALTWDQEVGEPFCTSCMVCIRNCPTQCMTATMKDNPLHAEGKSSRRKIVDLFEINLNRCILCGICVEVCNFDAIVMSHEHEMSTYQRNGDRVDLPALLTIGQKYQRETGWQPAAAKGKKAAVATPKPQPAAVSAEGEAKA